MHYPVGSIGVVAIIHTQCPYKTLICSNMSTARSPPGIAKGNLLQLEDQLALGEL